MAKMNVAKQCITATHASAPNPRILWSWASGRHIDGLEGRLVAIDDIEHAKTGPGLAVDLPMYEPQLTFIGFTRRCVSQMLAWRWRRRTDNILKGIPRRGKPSRYQILGLVRRDSCYPY